LPRRAAVDLGGASGAQSRIGRDLGVRRVGHAVGDAKAGGQHARQSPPLDPLDARQWRRLALQPAEQRTDAAIGAGYPDQHAAAVVQHLAVEAEFVGEPPYGRPEAYSLYSAAHADLGRTCGGRGRRFAGDRHRLPHIWVMR